ncbi:MAG: TonB-dependent receptor [Bacteroidales bacterium]|nr:TonB-dependent receptor [Bacteroidales bacterium]
MKTLFLCLAFCVSLISYAQTTQLNGKIVDQSSNEVLPGANVYVEGSLNGCSSNSDGIFSLRTKKSFPLTLIISYVGYQTVELNLDKVPTKDLIIKLKLKETIADEIIIKGVRQGENTPITYTNIVQIELEQINTGQDMPILLEMTPSLTTTSDAGTGFGYTGLRIRGTDQNRINVSINGVPYNDPESHGVYWVDVPDLASGSESIQIQRGVGTSSNGAASFGGSINIQTIKLNPNAYAKLNSRFGSYNTYGSTLLFGSGLINGKWVLDGRTSLLHSDGYVDRAYTDIKSIYLNGGYYGEKTMIRALIMSGIEDTYQAWSGIPKDSLETNRTYNPYSYENEIDHYQQDHYHLLISNQHNRNWSSSATLFLINGNGYYEQYRNDDDFADYAIPYPIIGSDTLESTNLIRRKWMDNSFYGGIFNINYDSKKKLDIVFGGGINRYAGNHFGNIIWMQFAGNSDINHEYYRNNGTKDDQNLYLKANYKLFENTTISADLQGRRIAQTVNGDEDDKKNLAIDEEYFFVNPKIGIFHQMKKHSFYAYVGMANREPNRYMLVDADSAQKPSSERLTDYEVGYRYQSENVSSNVNFYYMNYKDQLVLTGEINSVGAPIYVNVPESYRAGVELINAWQIHKKLKWNNSTTFAMNKIKNFTAYIDDWDTWGQVSEFYPETDISFSPAIILSNSFEIKPVKNLSILLSSKYVSRQYIDNTASKERSLDPYFVNNVHLQYTLKPKFVQRIAFRLAILNILSEEYENNAWVYRYYYSGEHAVMDGYFPQSPINFMGSVQIDF